MSIVAFYGCKNILSNFYVLPQQWDFEIPGDFCDRLPATTPRTFLIDNSEVSIMLMKAALMGDEDSLLALAGTTSPLQAKRLGRKVRPWDQSLWESRIELVALVALRSKFAAGSAAADALLSTGDATLIEASPGDNIWGCGLSCDMVTTAHADGDDAVWMNAGRNLLGSTLEIVRFELAQNISKAPCTTHEAD
jgi:ribA/ribD-fused uncharacterized protein